MAIFAYSYVFYWDITKNNKPNQLNQFWVNLQQEKCEKRKNMPKKGQLDHFGTIFLKKQAVDHIFFLLKSVEGCPNMIVLEGERIWFDIQKLNKKNTNSPR